MFDPLPVVMDLAPALNTPLLVGVLVWLYRIDKRLSKVEGRLKM